MYLSIYLSSFNHLISSHLMSSYRIASHLISPYLPTYLCVYLSCLFELSSISIWSIVTIFHPKGSSIETINGRIDFWAIQSSIESSFISIGCAFFKRLAIEFSIDYWKALFLQKPAGNFLVISRLISLLISQLNSGMNFKHIYLVAG